MPKYTLDWNKYIDTAIRAAEEGAVLLKNDNEALPVAKGAKVAVFGRMQANYYKSGTGSGGMVNVTHVTDILEGLENDPDIVVNETLKNVYAEWEKENPVDNGVGWGKERWSQDEMPLDDALVDAMSKENDVAIMIIARTAGEDRDNTAEKGSYYLTDGEEEMLSKVCSKFSKTVVLLNVGNIIDMEFVTKYNPSAVMYVWQAGMIGGTAVANLVSGKANPSGCLTDTIAYKISDYPSDSNFLKDDMMDKYAEDVFVGYRYFSTFAPEKVMYPFGFGLSYTTFETSDVTYSSETGKVTVKVTNTGKVAGKYSVKLFCEAPAGKIAKPSRALVGFAKTPELAPGETTMISIVSDEKTYASYDDDGRSGHGTAWVLEAGKYNFYLGSDVASATYVGSFEAPEDKVIEQLQSAFKPVTAFDRMTIVDGKLAYEPTPLREVENIDTRLERCPAEIPQTGDKGIKLADVKLGKATMDEFIAQLEDEDLSLIIRGEGMSSPKVTTGIAGAYGGISKELVALGIPAVACSDGPSGMRIDSGKKAFAVPNGTCLASTFNVDINEELFTYFGIEMISNQIDAILGPGINIHRHPLNGRNFEYFSEDPYLTGMMAVAQIEGLEKNGVTAVIKHFCCNNRETKRRLMDSVLSERALREIYLRPYEYAIKNGKARSIMSSYNKINGTYASVNYEMNTMVLREQWGYTGIVMTDWWAFLDIIPKHHHDPNELRSHSIMARAQNDLYMVCSAVERKYIDESDIIECLEANNTERITRAELQRNAANIIRYAMNTPAMDRLMGDKAEVEHIDCPFKDDTIEAKVDKYYELDGTLVIDVEEDTSKGKDYTFGVTCLNPGVYDMKITASSDLNPLAQIPMTIYYTSIPVAVVTWNGTEGEDVVKSDIARVFSTYSVYRFHFNNPGVKLKKIEMSWRCTHEEMPMER